VAEEGSDAWEHTQEWERGRGVAEEGPPGERAGVVVEQEQGVVVEEGLGGGVAAGVGAGEGTGAGTGEVAGAGAGAGEGAGAGAGAGAAGKKAGKRQGSRKGTQVPAVGCKAPGTPYV
jgi:hypothetical protein